MTTGSQQRVVVIIAVATLIYLWKFYTLDDKRHVLLQMLFQMIFAPDVIVHGWVGEDWSRFGLLDHVPVLLGAAVIFGVSGATGWLLIAAFQVDKFLSRAERTVYATAVGLNVWSLYALAVGLAGLLRERWVFAVPAVAVCGCAAWRAGVARLGSPTRPRHGLQSEAESEDRCSWFGRVPLVLCIPFAVVIVLGGTLPPTHFDVREYHLQVPKEWFQQGRISFLPHNVYGNMPLGASMWAILGMTMSSGLEAWWWGALIGKTVIAMLGPLGAAGVFVVGRRLVSSDAGAWGAFAYLSTPWVGHVSMNGLIDGAVACFTVLAVGAMLMRRAERPFPAVALAGFLAGAAVACKYPSLLFVVVPLFVMIAFRCAPECRGPLSPRPRSLREFFPVKELALFAIMVAAGSGLWFGKNLVFTGNPTYPLLYSIFGGDSWTAEKNARWTKAHSPPRDSNGRSASPTQVWDSLHLLLIRSDHHSPLLVPLLFAAGLAWYSPRRRLLSTLAGFSAFSIVCWFSLTHRLDRFLVPLLPLAALSGGIGVMWTDQRAWRFSVVGLAVACGLTNFLHVSSPLASENRILVALRDLREDVPRRPDHSDTHINDGHRYLNEHVADGWSVLMVGEAQVFDLKMPILYNTCFDDCVFETLLKNKSLDERRRVLREHRISHVFVSWYELDRYREPGNYGYSDYPTRERLHREMVAEQGLLRLIPMPTAGQMLQLFEVVGWRDGSSPVRGLE